MTKFKIGDIVKTTYPYGVYNAGEPVVAKVVYINEANDWALLTCNTYKFCKFFDEIEQVSSR